DTHQFVRISDTHQFSAPDRPLRSVGIQKITHAACRSRKRSVFENGPRELLGAARVVGCPEIGSANLWVSRNRRNRLNRSKSVGVQNRAQSVSGTAAREGEPT